MLGRKRVAKRRRLHNENRQIARKGMSGRPSHLVPKMEGDEDSEEHTNRSKVNTYNSEACSLGLFQVCDIPHSDRVAARQPDDFSVLR